MNEDEKKWGFIIVLALVALVIYSKFRKTSVMPPAYGGNPGTNTNPGGVNFNAPTGYAGPGSPGASTPSDTQSWIQFGAAGLNALGNVGTALVNQYGGTNSGDESSDDYSY